MYNTHISAILPSIKEATKLNYSLSCIGTARSWIIALNIRRKSHQYWQSRGRQKIFCRIGIILTNSKRHDPSKKVHDQRSINMYYLIDVTSKGKIILHYQALKLSLINTRSVLSKIPQLHNHLSGGGIDLHVLTETWIKVNDTCVFNRLSTWCLSYLQHIREKQKGKWGSNNFQGTLQGTSQGIKDMTLLHWNALTINSR